MKLARSLELRLERLVEGLSAALFRGRMHPVDMANRLIRFIDLNVEEGPAGPRIANVYLLRVNPGEIADDLDISQLEFELAGAVAATATDNGWQLGGPVEVVIEQTTKVASGSVGVVGTTRPGPLPPWGQLIGDTDGSVHDLSDNRMLLGRSPDADIVLRHQRISRRHAVVFRRDGVVWIGDAGSANGTTINGETVGTKPLELRTGDSISLGPATFSVRFV